MIVMTQTKKQAAAVAAKGADIDIRWHPPATAIADGPRVTPGQRVNHGHGLGSKTLGPKSVRWRTSTWMVAWSRDHSTLWVLTEEEITVLQNRDELVEIALVIASAGEVAQAALDAASAAATLASIAPAKRPKGPRQVAELTPTMDKTQALRTLTAAAAHAFVAGATLVEVRGAVFAAMGLDYEDSPE